MVVSISTLSKVCKDYPVDIYLLARTKTCQTWLVVYKQADAREMLSRIQVKCPSGNVYFLSRAVFEAQNLIQKLEYKAKVN